jgi:hypothetical protein
VPSSPDSVLINATLSHDGYIFCSAFLEAKIPVSVWELLVSGTRLHSIFNSARIKLNGLSPGSSLEIYCATSSFSGTFMTLPEMLDTRHHVTMPGHLGITVDLVSRHILSHNLQILAQVGLQESPLSPLVLQPQVSRLSTSHLRRLQSPDNFLFPLSLSYNSTVIYSQLSRSLFFYSTSPESYLLSMSVRNQTSSNYVITYPLGQIFTVNSSSIVPSPPELISAAFISDGGMAEFRFSHETNQPLSSNQPFFCDEVLNFPMASSTTCSWTDSTHLVATLNANSELVVGSVVKLQENVVTSACGSLTSGCSSLVQYSSGSVNMTSTVTLLPVIIISAPSVITESTFFILDLTSSTGSGGRPWKDVQISVASTADTSLIQQFFSSSYTVVPPTPLSPGLFTRQHYYNFLITLCNFLDHCRSASFRLYCGVDYQPSMAIYGAPSKIVSTADALVFEAKVFYDQLSFPTYANFVSAYQPSYRWSIFDLTTSQFLNFGQGIPLESQSLNLPHYFLPSQHIVDLRCRVILNNGKWANASAVISVLRPTWTVQINIGDGTTIRAGATLTLKATPSLEAANPIPYRFSYQWECIKIRNQQPSICSPAELCSGSSCSNSIVTLKASSDVAQYFISASITDLISLETDSITRTVEVIPPLSPKLSIVPIQSVFDYKQQLQVRGYINSPFVGVATWSSNLPLAQSSYQTPSQLFVTTTNSDLLFNFVLAPNSLRSASRYKFTLSLATSTNVYTTSIDLATFSPPQPGIVSVTPNTGLELTQIFSFSASYWSDADLPLSYSFEYSHPGKTYVTLANKLSSNHFDSVLPAQQNTNTIVKCRVAVSDYYGATNFAYSSLFLFAISRNYSQLADNIKSQSQSEDDTVVLPTYPVYAPIGSSKSCDLAPNCTTLNREICSAKENTCGPCLSQFYGVSDDDNTPCSRTTVQDGTLCQDDSDCLPYLSCETGACVVTNKTCPNDCSGHGSCSLFAKSSGQEVSKCLKSDSTCEALCTCDDTHFGDSCATPAPAATSQSSLVQEIICGISFRINRNILYTSRLQQWVTILQLLSQNPRVISSRSAFCAVNISNILLDRFETSTTTIDLTVVHSLVDTLTHYHAFLDARTISSDLKVTLLGAITQLLFRYCHVMSQSMVVGQFPSLETGSYVDSTRSRYAPQSNLTLRISNTYNPITDSSVSYHSREETTICLSSIHPLVYRDLVPDISSPVVSVLVEVASSNQSLSNRSDRHLNVTLVTSEAMSYGLSTDSSTFKVTCNNDQHLTLSCPGGLEYELDCTNKTGSYQVACPRLLLHPGCGYLNDLTVESQTCEVISSTLTTVTCSCPLNFTSGSQQQAVIQVVALAQIVPEGVIVLSDAETPQAISKPWQVFLALSLACAFCLTGVYYSNKADEEEISYEKVLDEDLSLRQILSALDTTIIDSVFPVMFSERSFIVAFFRELKQSHRWLSIFFFFTPFFPRWYRTLSLFSAVNIFMFCLCVFYGHIAPYDDLVRDRCEEQTTRDFCLTEEPRYVFLTLGCRWDHGGQHCEADHSKSNFEIPFLVAVLCALMSAPIVMLIDYLLFEIIAKPSNLGSQEKKQQKSLNLSASTPVDLHDLLNRFMKYREELSYKARREFDRVWSIDPATTRENLETNEMFVRLLAADLEVVQSATRAEIAIISRLPTSGARSQRLMFLFQQDLMLGVPGEVVTRKAYHLSTHYHSPSQLLQNVLWGVIVLINLALIIYVFLFGWVKGYFLQSLWAKTLLVWLFLDLFVVQSLLTLVSQFLIPSVMFTEIFRTRFYMLRAFQEAQERINAREPLAFDPQKFNASSFMFASHRLAQLTPNSFESRLILNFRTPFPKKRSLCSLRNQDIQRGHVVISPLYAIPYYLVCFLMLVSHAFERLLVSVFTWILCAVLGLAIIFLAHQNTVYFALVIPAILLPMLLVGALHQSLVMQPRELGIEDFREFYGLQSMNSGTNPKVLPRSSSSGVVDDKILRDLDMDSGDVAITVHDHPVAIVPVSGSPKRRSTEQEIVDYMKSMVAENDVEWGDLDGQQAERSGNRSKLQSILMKPGMMDKLFDLSDDENESSGRRGRRRAARPTQLRRMRSYSEDDMSLPSPSNVSALSPRRVKKSLSDESEPRTPKPSLQRLRSLSDDDFQRTHRSPSHKAERAEKEIVEYMKTMVEENQVEWGELEEVKRSQDPSAKTSKLIQILERNGVMDKLFDLSDEDEDELGGKMRPRRRAARFTHLNRLRSLSDGDTELPSTRLARPPLNDIESLSSNSDFGQEEDEVSITHHHTSSLSPQRPSMEIRDPERPSQVTGQPQEGGGLASALAAKKAYTMAAVNKDISFKFKRAKNEQSLQDRLEKKRASATGASSAAEVPSTGRKESEVSKDLTKRLEANMARRRMSLASSEQAAKNRLEQRLQGRLQQHK